MHHRSHDRGVSVQEAVSPGGVSVWGGFCLGVSVWWVSVWGVTVQGVPVRGGFCQGDPLPPYCYVRVVRILLERILVFFWQSIMHDFNILKNFPYTISLIRTIQLFSDKKHWVRIIQSTFTDNNGRNYDELINVYEMQTLSILYCTYL